MAKTMTRKARDKTRVVDRFNRRKNRRNSNVSGINSRENSRKFYSHDDKDRRVAKFIDFEAAKMKRKRMNSISGYRFYPYRKQESSFTDRKSPYKKLTSNLIKKIH